MLVELAVAVCTNLWLPATTLLYIWSFVLSFTHAFISQLVMSTGPLSQWEEYTNSTGSTVVFTCISYTYVWIHLQWYLWKLCKSVWVWGRVCWLHKWQVTRQAADSMPLTCIYGLEAHTKWQRPNVTLMCHQSHTHIRTYTCKIRNEKQCCILFSGLY